jgi:hypothetical protein
VRITGLLGELHGNDKDLPKAKIKKYRDARRAKKLKAKSAA